MLRKHEEWQKCPLKRQKKALEKIQKTEPKEGANIVENIANIDAYDAEIAEAQKKADFWQGVVDEMKRREEAETQETVEQLNTEQAEVEQQAQQPAGQTGQTQAGTTETPTGEGGTTEAGTATEQPAGTPEGGTQAQTTAEQPNGFQYFSGSLSELVKGAKKKMKGLVKKVIAPVSSRLRQDLRGKGIDVDEEYKHVVDNYAIRHALKQHSGEKETKRGQIPLSESDFERISDVVENYDAVEVDTGKGREIIRYRKSYADGTTIYVEEKRDKHKELAAVTMWKQKGSELPGANRTQTTQIPDLNGTNSGSKVTENSGAAQREGGKNSQVKPGKIANGSIIHRSSGYNGNCIVKSVRRLPDGWFEIGYQNKTFSYNSFRLSPKDFEELEKTGKVRTSVEELELLNIRGEDFRAPEGHTPLMMEARYAPKGSLIRGLIGKELQACVGENIKIKAIIGDRVIYEIDGEERHDYRDALEEDLRRWIRGKVLWLKESERKPESTSNKEAQPLQERNGIGAQENADASLRKAQALVGKRIRLNNSDVMTIMGMYDKNSVVLGEPGNPENWSYSTPEYLTKQIEDGGWKLEEEGKGSAETPTQTQAQGAGTAVGGGRAAGNGEVEANGSAYKLSGETDEKGHPFVLSSDGSTTFGEIGKETGLPSAPIKLSEGVITNPKNGDGYGLVHIEAKHGDQIRKAGYKDVVSFVEDVAKNWTKIRKGNKRGGNQTYFLELKDKHNNTLVVELSRDGEYWNINTAAIFNEGYSKKREEVFSRPAAAAQPTTTGGVTQSATRNGSEVAETSRDNTSNNSADKGTTNTGTGKEKGKKNAGEGKSGIDEWYEKRQAKKEKAAETRWRNKQKKLQEKIAKMEEQARKAREEAAAKEAKEEDDRDVPFSVEERKARKAEREKVEKLSKDLEETLTRLNVPRVVCRSAEEMVEAYHELTGKRISLEQARNSNALVDKVDGEDVVFFNVETLASGKTAERAAARGREITAHEVLGHYGLPVLMGEEGHKRFCTQVYGSMSEAAREHFNAYYFDYNLNRGLHGDILKRLGLDADTRWKELTAEQKAQVIGELGERMTRGAADEYVAHLAEKVERGEVLAKEEKTLWDSIVDYVRRLLGFDVDDETFGDRDIAKAIMDSKKNLEERARLDEVEDALEEARESGDKKAEKRLTKERDAIEKSMEDRRASVEREMDHRDKLAQARENHDVFGEANAIAGIDAERRKRRGGDVRRSKEDEREFAERGRAIEAIEPTVVERPPRDREEAREIYSGIGKVRNKADGREVEFYKSAFKKDTAAGGDLFMKAVPGFKKSFENSVLAYSERDNRAGEKRPDGTAHKAHPNIEEYHNYVGKIRIGDRDYYARFTVTEEGGRERNGLHSAFVTNVKLYEEGATPTAQSGPYQLRGRDPEGVADAKLREFFERARKAGEKVSSEGENSGDLRFSTQEAKEAGERAQQISDEAEKRLEEGWRDEAQTKADDTAKRLGLNGYTLPQNADLDNTDGAVVREAARRGTLKGALGEDWNEFLKKVYQNTDEETLRDINELARQNGWNFAEATEQYLASLSDNGAFEQAVERGMWDNVKGAFDEALEGKGIEGVSDNDARYALWRNEQNKTEGADDTILAKATEVATNNALDNGSDTRFSTRDDDPNDPRVLYRDGVNEPAEVARMLDNKFRGSRFQMAEAWQDSMQALFSFMKACQGKAWKGVEEIADWMNPYIRENRLSSKNDEDQNTFTRKYLRPMLDEVAKLAGNERGRKLLNNYIIAKHGLERNEYMAEREARKLYDQNKAKGRFYKDMEKTSGEEEIRGKFRWVGDKEKALEWLGMFPPKGTPSLTPEELSVAKVIENFENPKLPWEKVSGGGENSSEAHFREREPETSLNDDIKRAEQETDTEPTEKQKESGNYKKGKVKVAGYDITIENPRGSTRSGTDANGKRWEQEMHNTYGYIKGTEGTDGDHIDVFLAPDMEAWDGEKVYVVDQYNPDGTFDEHKVMLGFGNAPEAKQAYLDNYEKGWENGRRIDVSEVDKDEFDKWIDSSHRKTKAFADYAGTDALTLLSDTEKQRRENANNAAMQLSNEADQRIAQTRANSLAQELGLNGYTLPDNADLDNTEGAVVREAARQGTLKGALGEDWNEFLKKVYQNTDEETLRDINELARQNGWNFEEEEEGGADEKLYRDGDEENEEEFGGNGEKGVTSQEKGGENGQEGVNGRTKGKASSYVEGGNQTNGYGDGQGRERVEGGRPQSLRGAEEERAFQDYVTQIGDNARSSGAPVTVLRGQEVSRVRKDGHVAEDKVRVERHALVLLEEEAAQRLREPLPVARPALGIVTLGKTETITDLI